MGKAHGDAVQAQVEVLRQTVAARLAHFKAIVPQAQFERPAAAAALPSATPRFDRRALEIHAAGRISDIFGPAFRLQDDFARQVRMPRPTVALPRPRDAPHR